MRSLTRVSVLIRASAAVPGATSLLDPAESGGGTHKPSAKKACTNGAQCRPIAAKAATLRRTGIRMPVSQIREQRRCETISWLAVGVGLHLTVPGFAGMVAASSLNSMTCI